MSIIVTSHVALRPHCHGIKVSPSRETTRCLHCWNAHSDQGSVDKVIDKSMTLNVTGVAFTDPGVFIMSELLESMVTREVSA